MKKIFAVILSFLCVCFSVCFAGCTESGPIPNGKYALIPNSNEYVFSENKGIEFYWEIDGDQAREYVSNSLQYKCNIVEENGKIYFEGYTWFEILLWRETGREFKYEVIYNGETKRITILY